MKASRFLIHPAWGKGRGSGHLMRSLALARALAGAGKEVFLCADEGLPPSIDASGIRLLSTAQARAGAADLVLADRFRTSASDMAVWGNAGLLVGLDEGGPFRGGFDFLIDILPGKRPRPRANIDGALGFLDLPLRRSSPVSSLSRILVSFGGEDPAALGPAAVKALLEAGFPPQGIGYLRGPLGPALPKGMEGVSVLEPTGKLSSLLGDWDCLLGAYGITAWEALASGAAVILAHPSPYHASLAAQAGFPSLGRGKPCAAAIRSALKEQAALISSCEGLRRGLETALASTPGEGRAGSARLASLLSSLELSPLPEGRRCVSCEHRGREGKSIWRDATRSYRRCPSCASVSMTRLVPNPLSYEKDYFFEEYRRQYGKTYLEDFPALKAMADRRLMRMEALLRGMRQASPPRVLDIGCAYGAFLDRARERGWEVLGMDPCADAVRFCREELGLQAFTGGFPKDLPLLREAGAPFQALSLWYVIEHLEDIARALDALRGLLLPGGILALSTPSGRGVSERLNSESFWKASPMDHMAVLDPRSIRAVLDKKGFRLLSTVSTGHHPERFPSHPRPGTLAYRALMASSRALSWGDTFEAYARRVD